jgi:hypothetical protein
MDIATAVAVAQVSQPVDIAATVPSKICMDVYTGENGYQMNKNISNGRYELKQWPSLRMRLLLSRYCCSASNTENDGKDLYHYTYGSAFRPLAEVFRYCDSKPTTTHIDCEHMCFCQMCANEDDDVEYDSHIARLLMKCLMGYKPTRQNENILFRFYANI